MILSDVNFEIIFNINCSSLAIMKIALFPDDVDDEEVCKYVRKENYIVVARIDRNRKRK